VRVETVLGVIDIELFDTAAPATVANFLNYVQNSKFDSTFFHRSVAGFVLQGGGYSINTTSNVVAAVPTFAPVVNEYSATRSNLRGTVAMAKLGSSPDSATSQWFVNLANNATNLDFQNGGFTVFGKVIGNGMAVVDAIAKLPVYTVNFGATVGSLTGVPLDMAGASSITAANLATVNRVAVLPSAVNAAAGWNLLGNGSDAPLTVASMFADAQRFVTVWKWVAGSTGGVWAFYSPVLAAQGGSILSDYAAGKGYQVLQSIDAGEGYWLNVAANQAGSINQPYGNAVTTATLNTSLKSGWNLAAIGTTASAKQVCAAQTSGVTSLWAWDNAQSKWFFYAPNLDAQAGTVLSDYILSKSYLDFSAQAKPLGFGQGFWVNRP
jgi:cyclophilin family peptidyl-prolyl cis-trans isomerase